MTLFGANVGGQFWAMFIVGVHTLVGIFVFSNMIYVYRRFFLFFFSHSMSKKIFS